MKTKKQPKGAAKLKRTKNGFIKKHVQDPLSHWLNTTIYSPFPPLSINRFRVTKILLRQKHPLIAARVILPGLFIGLVGGLGMIYATNHYSPHIVHATGSTANLFVVTSGGTASCVRSATQITFAAAAANNKCSSFLAACLVHQDGDVAVVEDGSYGSQDLSTCTGHANDTQNFIYKPEAGSECPNYYPNVPAVGTDMSCNVSVSDLSLRNQFSSGGNCPGGSTGHNLASTYSSYSQWLNHVEFHDMYLAGFTSRCTRYLVFSNVDGQNFFLRSAYHVQILGGSWGNQFTGDCPQIGNFVGPDAPITQDVLVSNVIVHDQRHDNSPATHPDGLFVQDSDTVTISGSIFVRDDVIPLYINGFGGAGISNLKIINNQIHTPTNHTTGYPPGAADAGGGNSLNLGDYPLTNVLVAFNSIEGPIYRHGPGCNSNVNPTNSNVSIYGNISSGINGDCDGNCKASITYDYNLVYGGGNNCGVNSVSANSGYTSTDVMDAQTTYGDHHLTTGAAAIDMIPTSFCTANSGVCPTTDFDGGSRPQGSAYDAGADEYLGGGGGDTTPPTVSITTPAAASNLKGTTSVTSSASDNVGVVGVQFKVDGVSQGAEDTTSPYSISWDTTGATNGSHTITAVARDAAGNTTTSAGVIVTVDNLAPTGSLTSPTNAASVKGSVSVSSNSADAGSGVASVQFKLDGANLGAADTTSPYSVSWDTTTASNGSHTLTAVTTDNAGNTTTSSTVTVTVDNSVPTVSLTAPTNGATVSGSNVSITATASDNVGVAGVQFTMDGGNQGAEDTTAPYSTVWDTTTLSNGSHTLTAIAHDAAGNITISSSITVTVNNAPPPPDTTPPSVPTGLAKSSSTTSTIVLTWNASTDNVGGTGVAGYKVFRGGSFVTQVSTPTYTDTGLSANTSYSYQVSAVDNASPTPNESIRSAAVNMSTSAVPAPTVSISAVPASITTGSSSSLSWSSTNATSCTASGSWSGSQATSGSTTVSPATSSTYTLTCSGSGGSNNASASLTVNANPPPPPPAPALKGDCNLDGHVNLIDLSILLSHYGQNYAAADFDSSGTVSLIDLSVLLSNYGK